MAWAFRLLLRYCDDLQIKIDPIERVTCLRFLSHSIFEPSIDIDYGIVDFDSGIDVNLLIFVFVFFISMGFFKVEAGGMEVVKKIYNCGEKPQQGSIQSQGNAYLDKQFPDLSRIVTATIIPDDEL
jgi:hypothetical protein